MRFACAFQLELSVRGMATVWALLSLAWHEGGMEIVVRKCVITQKRGVVMNTIFDLVLQ